MVRLGIFALVVALSTSLAYASCPTRSDLVGGVYTIRNEPYIGSLWTQTDEGLIERRLTERDGEVAEVAAIYAHTVAVIQRDDGGSRLQLVYDGDPAALDALPLGDTWMSGLRLLSDGTEVASGQVSVLHVEDGFQSIGACTYAVWVMRSTMQLDGLPGSTFDYLFAPDLGLNVAVVRLDEQGNPISGVFFDEIRAR